MGAERMKQDMAVYAAQFVLALVLAPLLPGIINRVKAKFAGRHGKPVLQTYYDIAKLLRKGEVISRTTTWTFAVAPSVALAGTLCALALLPLGALFRHWHLRATLCLPPTCWAWGALPSCLARWIRALPLKVWAQAARLPFLP
mgnify:CR=1 FL=1